MLKSLTSQLNNNIDLLNIIFMLVSLIIAIIIPFELFLFSYAVLGPLHYLTEINWLKDKNYFMLANVKYALILLVITILISIAPILNFLDLDLNITSQRILDFLSRNSGTLLLSAFLFSIGLLFYKSIKTLLSLLVVIGIVVFLATKFLQDLFLFIAVFLPTIIHVYLFTLLFILFGSIKSKSKTGIYSVLVLAAIPFIISFLPRELLTLTKPSIDTIDTFLSSNFATVSANIAKLSGSLENDNFAVISEIGIKIQIFIAFAYTYHYLNWFSKTSIIGWGKTISKQKLFWILFIYILSIGIYLYDYKTGLIALFFLSYLHVFLEFPLNAFTIKSLIGMIKKN